MMEFRVTADPNQQFSVFIGGRRVTLRLWWATVTNRWSFDLSIDDLPVITGRRIVTNVDLLRPFGLDIGSIFCVPIVPDSVPDRTGLPNGNCRLYHATQAEIDAAISA